MHRQVLESRKNWCDTGWNIISLVDLMKYIPAVLGFDSIIAKKPQEKANLINAINSRQRRTKIVLLAVIANFD